MLFPSHVPFLRSRLRLFLAVVAILLVGIVQPGFASSAIVTPQPGYQANDLLTAQSFGGFDVTGSQVAGWVNGNLDIFQRNTGTSINFGGAPSAYLSANKNTIYNSFVRFDPASSSTVYAGFTVSGNTDDRIYQVDLTGNTATWTNIATISGNDGMAYSGTTAYVSGTDGSGAAAIYKLTGGGPEQIAAAGGSSAGLAFDSAGNLDYAAYNGYGTSTQLLQWTASQVAGASSSALLTRTDATVLSSLPAGAYDTAVDSGGHVLFDLNGLTSGSILAMWNGTAGSGSNYTTLAVSKSKYPWFTNLATVGDITQPGGGVFVADPYSVAGIAQVSTPEPATVLLLLVGGALIVMPRRRQTHAA